ncbi:MAG: Opr family porin [Campylobacter sp.]|nr:Opr family porin [Campylobacter sp.]
MFLCKLSGKTRMRYALSLISALLCTQASGTTLEEAFKNGKTSGDISLFYESRHVNSGEKSVYFNDTAWAIGSVSLKYETDYFKNFKAVIGFRGSAPIYEDDRHFDTGHGRGDSTERIYKDNRFMLSNLYLEYNAYDTVIKIGRQETSFDWITKVNDGVSIVNNSISNLTLDAIWTRARGKVQLNEMFKVKKINKNSGMFAAGATYKFDMGLAVRGYAMHADDIFTGGGAKLMYDGSVSENLSVGGMAHFAKTDERKNEDGKIFEGTAYAKYKDVKFTLGYVQTGKKNGWGSLNKAGDKIVQFEEGDVMYERDVRTYYGMLSAAVQKLSIDAIFGTTEYKLKGGDDKNYRQNELSLWFGYPITDNLAAQLTFDRTFKKQPGYPSLTQVSAGLSYKF